MYSYAMEWCYSLIVCSALIEFMLFFIPNDKNKRLIEIGGTCIIFMVFLRPISDIDTKGLFSEITSYLDKFQVEQALSEDINNEINKTLIEDKYEEYIISEAKGLDVMLNEVSVVTYEDEVGNWIPSEIRYVSSDLIPDSFIEHIYFQLGVPKERQITDE